MEKFWFLLIFLFSLFEPLNGFKLNQTSETHTCPNGWVIGNNCGKEWCYKIVSVPVSWRVNCVENNYCKLHHSKALPVSIHCEQENQFFTEFPYSGPYPNAQYAIGLFIPQKVGWHKNNFRYRDGTKVDFESWAGTGRNKEPNGMTLYKNPLEKIAVYVVLPNKKAVWADFNPGRIRHMICKMAAEPLPEKSAPIPLQFITVLPTVTKRSCYI